MIFATFFMTGFPAVFSCLFLATVCQRGLVRSLVLGGYFVYSRQPRGGVLLEEIPMAHSSLGPGKIDVSRRVSTGRTHPVIGEVTRERETDHTWRQAEGTDRDGRGDTPTGSSPCFLKGERSMSCDFVDSLAESFNLDTIRRGEGLT
jgi:hypothetical protein